MRGQILKQSEILYMRLPYLRLNLIVKVSNIQPVRWTGHGWISSSHICTTRSLGDIFLETGDTKWNVQTFDKKLLWFPLWMHNRICRTTVIFDLLVYCRGVEIGWSHMWAWTKYTVGTTWKHNLCDTLQISICTALYAQKSLEMLKLSGNTRWMNEVHGMVLDYIVKYSLWGRWERVIHVEHAIEQCVAEGDVELKSRVDC